MTIIRWSPFQELENMQKELMQLLGDADLSLMPQSSQWVPPVDILETDDALLVEAELPGINKKDVQLELREGVLTISGERKVESTHKEEKAHRSERAYGRFIRSFSLPVKIDSERAEARMKNGVLEIRLPKLDSAKRREIVIN
jgi:HSP20 family protein